MMANSTIDSLFQLATPRAAEPARGPAAPFDPALREALAPSRQTERAPASAPSLPTEQPKPAEEDVIANAPTTDERAADQWPDESVDEAAGSTPDAEPAGAEEEDADTVDEAEISDVAAAALAAAEAKTKTVVDEPAEQGGESSGPVRDDSPVAAVPTSAAAENDETFEGQPSAQTKSDASAGDGEPQATEAAIGEQARSASRRRSTEHLGGEVKEEAIAGERPVAAKPAAQQVDADSAAAAEGEPAASNAAKLHGADGRADRTDQIDTKQLASGQPQTSPVESAASEAPAELPPVKSEAAPAVAVPNSAPRSAAEVEKLVGSRGIIPAAADGVTADGGPPVDRARFVQRVEGALRHAHDRDGRLHVRLSPPELGSIRIEIALHHGVMTAKLEAETTAARNLIMEHLPVLRERLAQQDVRIEKFDVDVRRDSGDGGSGSGGDPGARERPAQQAAWRQDERRARPAPAREARAEPPAPAKAAANAAGLDVRV